jgi:hypothetical protein
MEQAGKSRVWFALERCGKGFRPAGHASQVRNKRLIWMSERWVGIHGLYSKMLFTALKVGATEETGLGMVSGRAHRAMGPEISSCGG